MKASSGNLADALPPSLAARLEQAVPLAPLTTLEVGGVASFFFRCREPEEVAQLLDAGRQLGLPHLVLGGGSNVLISDQGYDGLVLQIDDDRVRLEPDGDSALLRAGAGACWDDLVATSVDAGYGGLECLSGIPGRVGAVPIQNVGAYGQEVSERLEAVHVVEVANGRAQRIAGQDCGFAYRWSHFKGAWRGQYVVTAVDFRLRRSARGELRYPELQRRFAIDKDSSASWPSPAQVREEVLAVRRTKSMVWDPEDPNRRSAGSFFLNPILDQEQVEQVRRRAERLTSRAMPAFAQDDGRSKLSAAWLIETAGFQRGHQQGRAGLSSRHVLALINRGGATAGDLLALAAEVRRSVQRKLGVRLQPEPELVGFDRREDPWDGPAGASDAQPGDAQPSDAQRGDAPPGDVQPGEATPRP